MRTAFRRNLLGRNVEHDPASRNFPAARASREQTVTPSQWRHHGATLDQKKVGSCTGNAGAGGLKTEPLYKRNRYIGERKAVQLYSLATRLDDISGEYPPDDTGSSGLGVAKALVELGYIDRYSHAFGLAHAIDAIALGPFITGTNWTGQMFTPDSNGFVQATGAVEGGHEYLCLGYDPDSGAWTFLNSWGKLWGVRDYLTHVGGGAFHMTSRTYGDLLDAQGDVTVLGR